jgi:hypothetical protein
MPYIDISQDNYSPDEITIDRENKDFPQTVSVNNFKGESLFTCDQSWTDDQIFKTVKVANHAFKLGQMRGSGDAFESLKTYAVEQKRLLNLR